MTSLTRSSAPEVDDLLPALGEVEILLVASYGRSGSSRLMELLQITRQAVVAGAFPHEVRSVQRSVVLGSGVGVVDDEGGVSFGGVVYPPWRPRRFAEPELSYRDAAMNELSHLWPYVDARQDVESLRIAEKAIGLQIVDLVMSSCPRARVAVLDRDPRDIFLSVLAFNERRRSVGFGAGDGPDELAHRIAEHCVATGELVQRWSGRAVTVRYPAMLSDPVGTIAELTGSTLVPSVDPRRLAEITAPEHVTSGTVARSVGRWRTHAATWSRQFALLARAHEQLVALTGT